MAGKNQHIIPQFLQRKFSKNKKQLVVYKKDKVYKININNNYSGNQYYSEENGILDYDITNEEQKYSLVLDDLLNKDINQQFDINTELNEFILHFFFRNKYIYEHLHLHFKNLINDSIKLLKEQGHRFYLNNKKELNKNGINLKNFEHLLNENVSAVQKTALDIMDNTLRSNFHSKSVNQNNKFSLPNFYYSIIESENTVLSDILFLVFSKNENSYIPFLDNKISHILFPISHNKILVIYEKNYDINNLSNININLIFIESAWESFSIDVDGNYDSFNLLKDKIRTNSFYNTFSLMYEELKKELSKDINLDSFLIELRKHPNYKK